MNCRNADLWIQKSLDEPLSPQERAALDAHLAGCAACRAAWDEYRALARSAAAWVDRAAVSKLSDDAFTQQLLARIDARATQSPPQTVFSRKWTAALCAALAGVTAVSVFAGPRLSPSLTWPISWLPSWTAFRELPNWLLGNAHDIAQSLTESPQALPQSLTLPYWVVGLLAAALLVNGLFFWRTITLNRRQPFS